MAVTDRVKQILSWYASDNPGTLTNLARLLNHGTLAGTGKLVILPVDQGFEHGPARSFAPNPAALRSRLPLPARHRRRAATPTRRRSASSRRRPPSSPGRSRSSSSSTTRDTLAKIEQPCSAVTGSVEDALRLGCVGHRLHDLPRLAARATRCTRSSASSSSRRRRTGLPSVVWSYPRGAGLSKDGETAIDVCAYAAQIAAPARRAHRQGQAAEGRTSSRPRRRRSSRSTTSRPKTLADRVRHVVQSALQRQAHRHLLGRRGQGHRRRARRGQASSPRAARFGSHHGAQRLPAPARRGAQAARAT